MDAVELDRRAGRHTATLIEATPPSLYDAETPCPEWSVRGLITHLIAGNLKYTAIAQGQEWARGVPEIVLGDDPAEMYRHTLDAMVSAWQQPGALDRDTALPMGRGRAELALYLHLGETLVHGWDLAKAIGRETAFDADIVEASLAQFTTWLPAQRRPGSPFADANAVPTEAVPIDCLAAYLGRDVEAWSS